MTTTFYTPPEQIRGNTLMLVEEEAHHALKVLRTRPGDEIQVVDGAGAWYRAIVEEAGRQGVTAAIKEVRQNVGEPRYELTVAMGILKNPSRYETFLEKAVELGVSRIVPLLTERTEKGRIKESRAQNILVAAMKQCGRSRLTRLEDPTPLDDFLAADASALKLICHETVDPEKSIGRVLGNHLNAERISILIGPEGGFSEEEVAQAESRGYASVSLGSRRLRAETAGLTAAAAVMLYCR